MTKRIRAWRWIAVGIAALLLASVPVTASAGTRDGNHCVFPPDGDFNEAFGITEAVVWFCNTEIGSGQDWRTNMAWGMTEKYTVKPKGFVAGGETPLDDFLAKFVGVRIVIDPGTSQQRTYVFTDTSKLVVLEPALVMSFDMGVMAPPAVGHHYLESYWSMSGVHCDGYAKKLEDCMPAGDSLGFATDFTVTPGN